MWMKEFSYLISVVKEFIVELWELRNMAVMLVLPPTLTPRGEIWIREVLVNWGMVRMVEVVS